MIQQLARTLPIVVFVNLSIGCVSLAPGADHVKMTSNASDVAACTAAGNVRSQNRNDVLNVDADLKNQAVGLYANVIFITGTGEGVAYRCDKIASPAT
jgi:hypothetical protein